MNLRSIDLNLLVVLDKLLDEAHVSRAATQLGLTQPAVSAALMRLRGLFDDELLPARARHHAPDPEGAGAARAIEGPARRRARSGRSAGHPARPDQAGDPLHRHRSCRRSPPAAAARAAGRNRAGHRPHPPPLGRRRQRPRRAAARRRRSCPLRVRNRRARAGARAGAHEHYVIAMRPGHPALDGFDIERWLAFPAYRRLRPWRPARLARRHIGAPRPHAPCRPRRAQLPDRAERAAPGPTCSPCSPRTALPARRASASSSCRRLCRSTAFVHLAWPTRSNGDKALAHVREMLAAALAEEISGPAIS